MKGHNISMEALLKYALTHVIIKTGIAREDIINEKTTDFM